MSMIGNLRSLSAAQLDALIENPSNVQSFIYGNDSAAQNHLDLDKAWHAIHFMLNNHPWEGNGPFANIVLGGTEIGTSVGYGPAHYLTPNEVSALSEALAQLSDETFRQAYRPDLLDEQQIYPQIWRRDGDEGYEYIDYYFQELKHFYHEAAQRGEAVIVYIN